jgi:hypothetical protein
LSQLTSHPYQKAPSPLSSDAAWQEFVSGDPAVGGQEWYLWLTFEQSSLQRKLSITIHTKFYLKKRKR